MSKRFKRSSVSLAARRSTTLAILLALAACSSSEPIAGGSANAADADAAPAPAAEVTPDAWPAIEPALAPDPALEQRVAELLAAMSLEEKVGQILQADIGSVTPELARQYHLGSVLAGGNSGPGGGQYGTAQAWLALADEYYAASTDTSDGKLGIPLLFGIDAVHGHNNVVGGTLFPHNIGLGATRNPELVRQIAAVTAVELRVTGAEWTFAPTLAVPRDDRWGRTYEGFSEDPAVVASFAAAIVEGLQGVAGADDFLDDRHVLSAAKHFLGDGGTAKGKDQGDAVMSEAELRDIHGAGYPPALAAGVQTVMASFSGWNGQKLHGHRGLLTEVLKGRMGFDGFVVGDWNGHGQVTGCSNTDCPQSVTAGVDMLMAPDSWRGLYDSLLAQARDGRLPMARLDDAVTRILRVKHRLGLFQAGPPSQRDLGGQFERIGHADHRALARRAVRESLVLLKNNNQLLPLNPNQRILVAGDGADNIGKQAGGWTLTWQGTGVRNENFPNAESIWTGIRTQVEAAGGTAKLDIDGRYGERPDVAIVVFGEEPYAEFQGDLQNLAYRPGDDRDLELLRRLQADGIPVVSVFLSGRPLWMNREINASDAFVAAWLPGSEGGGVADLLLRAADGSMQHDFTGTLSFSWPRSAAQSPLNVGEAGYDPLFAFGHGLTYSGKQMNVEPLPEDSGIGLLQAPPGLLFARGVAGGDYRLLLESGGDPLEVDTAPTQTGDGNLRLTSVDHSAQEDARLLVWSGPASAALEAAQPLDLDRETNGDVLLVLTLRVDSIGSAAQIGMDCGEGCAARLPLADALQGWPAATWKRLGIPLKCFRAAGADMRALGRPLVIEADVGTRLALSRAELATDADQRLECSGA